MKYQNINKSLVILALALSEIHCATSAARTVANASPTLHFTTYTADDAGFDVNSHLIFGETEALLVDAQFTNSQAEKVVTMIKDSRKELKTIFITHGHPDHYLGLSVIKNSFPRARIVASRAIVDDIKATAQSKIDFWKPIYKNDLAASFVLPEAYDDATIDVEGHSLQIIRLGQGESEHADALYEPQTRTLVSGDLIYSGVHLWLAEQHQQQWLANLAAIRNIGAIDAVLPGHGKIGGPALIEINEAYIANFNQAVDEGRSRRLNAENVLARLLSLYPDYRLPVIAKLSVEANMK